MEGWKIALIVIGILWLISFFYGTVVPFLWAKHKFIRDRIPLFKNNYEGPWAGEGTARFRKGRNWWGYNSHTKKYFFVRNGGAGRPSFQLASRPEKGQTTYMTPFRIWGYAWPWQRFRKERKLGMDFTREEMHRALGVDLGVLPSGHYLRPEVEEDLRKSVRRAIEKARNGDLGSIGLLRNSLSVKPYQMDHSFAAWYVRRGTLIGVKRSYQIGKEICQEMGFDLNEAKALYERHKSENSRRRRSSVG